MRAPVPQFGSLTPKTADTVCRVVQGYRPRSGSFDISPVWRVPGGLNAAAPRTAPPRGGAVAVSTSAWLPCVHLNLLSARPAARRPGLTRLPRLVARGYLAAVLGRSTGP